MMTPETFFPSLLPHFQNNAYNLINYFFENKLSIPKSEFLNKCTQLNLFPKDQILYIYSKLDTNFSNKIDKTQIEYLIPIQRQSFSAPHQQGQPGFYPQQPPPHTSDGINYPGYQGFPQAGNNSFQNFPQNPVIPLQQSLYNPNNQGFPQAGSPNFFRDERMVANLPPSNIITNPSTLYQTQLINYQGQDIRNSSAG